MTDNPYRRAREMIESSCPSDVKAEIREVTDKWKDARPRPHLYYRPDDLRQEVRRDMQRSIERQARAWAFWRGVLWGAIFAGAVVFYLLKGLVGG